MPLNPAEVLSIKNLLTSAHELVSMAHTAVKEGGEAHQARILKDIFLSIGDLIADCDRWLAAADREPRS